MKYSWFFLIFYEILLINLGMHLKASSTNLLSESEIIQISAEDLKQEMNDKNGILLINVLNKHTYKDCSIHGSLHIPVQNLSNYVQKKIKKRKWSYDQEIVVYCAGFDCPLSKHACKILRSVGFLNVRLFRGGMRDWKQRGYPYRGKARAGYLKG